jgi:enoyl-CoA hydratase/carnithine racemase
MPTITLISGQAAGLGFVLALCHDFRIQKSSGSSLCIREGLSATPSLSMWILDFVKARLPASNVTRSMLAGESLRARDSVRFGLVNETGFFENALRLIERRGLLDVGTDKTYCTAKELKNKRAIDLLNTRYQCDIKTHRL